MSVTIISETERVTPPAVQNAIRNRFVFSKNKEVSVRISNQNFDVYQNEKYVCSFDELGNEI